MPTNRSIILDRFQARLESILTADGFDTDAGEAVFRGESPALGPGDPDVAIAMLVGEDAVQFQGERFFIHLPIDVQVVAKADLDAPWEAIERVLGDVKRAIELTDRTLDGAVKRQLQRGSTRTLEREEGSTTVGVVVTYTAPYIEEWGAP